MYLPILYVFVLFIYIQTTLSHDVEVGNHNKIVTVAIPHDPHSTKQLKYSIRQIFANETSEVAGIKNSRLGYSQTSGITGGVVIPGQVGVKYTFSMEGSIKFVGVLKSQVQDITENLVTSYSSKLQDWYRSETKSLRSRAGGGFFSFFQAAANYGYTKNRRTREILDSGEFKRFSEEAGSLLGSLTTQELEGKFSGSYEATSVGVRETVSMFAYIYINQITLDSGKIFNVVSRNPALVIADQNGKVRNDTTTIPVTPVGPPGGTIDTTIGQ